MGDRDGPKADVHLWRVVNDLEVVGDVIRVEFLDERIRNTSVEVQC